MLAKRFQVCPTPVDLKFWDGIAERIYYVRAIFRTPKLQSVKEHEQADKLHNTLETDLLFGCPPQDSSLRSSRSWEIRPHEGRERPRGTGDRRKAIRPYLESAKQLNRT